MSWQSWIVVLLIVVLGGLQYGLMVYAIRDLLRRPRVRGDNKVLWAIVILILPIAGAVLYASIGPTSFLPRPERSALARRPPRPPNNGGS